MKALYTFIVATLFPALMIGQCIEDSHSSFEGQGWISCTKSLSDIPDRGEQHWIKYDFGHEYYLTDMDIWNHNTWGQTNAGAKTIMIDYSLDNNSWSSVGPISIEQAPGSWRYTGIQGIDLGDINCKYLILTVLETWDEDEPCAALSEIRFNVDLSINTEEVDELATALLYPNPASEMITLEHQDLQNAISISIVNAIGQVVLEVPLTKTSKVSIPVGSLKNGVYYISLTTQSQIITKAFVKQ